MLSTLPLLLSLMATDADAKNKKGKGMLDHERSVTVAPFKLIEPRFHAEYEQMLSKQTSFTAGATYGRFNSLLLRLGNAASEALGGEEYVVNNTGVNGAFNYYFKNFNRGWYAGGAVEFDMISATYGDEDAGSYNVVEIGPTIGWKRCTEGGFTFSWDWGVGYGAVFGEEEGGGTTTPGSVAFLGSLMMGYSF
ncbi:MAG: hypothetical protein CL927_18120 [Deltaproteobacteria bacterium]|nr:hypothetical protein [Deltaproteobacteria bacterium]